MLVIRNEQMRVLGERVRAQYVERLADHVRQQQPAACVSLSQDELETLVAQGVGRAATYGFLSERDVSRYVLVQFMLGADFDTDARHAWARTLLDPQGGRLPSFRSEQLLDEATAWAQGQAPGTETPP